MLRRSEFMRENCPSYFDRITYYLGHTYMLNDAHLAKPTGTKCAICFLYSALEDKEYLRRIIKHLDMQEAGFILPLMEHRIGQRAFHTQDKFVARHVGENGQVLYGVQSLVLATAVLAQAYGNNAQRFSFLLENGYVAQAYAVDEETIALEVKMAVSCKFVPSEVRHYEDLVSALFSPSKTKKREFWYCAALKIMLVHIVSGIDQDLMRLRANFEDFPVLKRRELEEEDLHSSHQYLTVIVSVGYPKTSVLDSFADVCCRAFILGRDPPEANVSAEAYSMLATLYARKLGRLKFRIKQTGLEGGEARIVVNPVANTVEMTSSYKLMKEEHVL